MPSHLICAQVEEGAWHSRRLQWLRESSQKTARMGLPAAYRDALQSFHRIYEKQDLKWDSLSHNDTATVSSPITSYAPKITKNATIKQPSSRSRCISTFNLLEALAPRLFSASPISSLLQCHTPRHLFHLLHLLFFSFITTSSPRTFHSPKCQI